MKYHCSVCEYETDFGGNFSKHKRTQSHIKKSLIFEKDEKKTKLINNEMVTIIRDEVLQSLKRDRENSENQKENKYTEKYIENLEKNNEYLKSLVEKAGNVTLSAISTAKSSINALNYVTMHYNNAPILKDMPNYDTIQEYCGEYNIASSMIELYTDDKLIKYLGGIIISNYKKENPHEQSLWNSDCNRLSYIVKTIVGKKSSWIADKKGIKLKELVIEPLLSHIKSELWEFMENSKDKIAEKSKQLGKCVDLIGKINNSVICDELLKFLAPHFHLSRVTAITNYDQIEKIAN